jgi:hypothetical protein
MPANLSVIAKPKDTITQTELRSLAELEVTVWKMMHDVHRAIARIGDRVENGAEVECGEFGYSGETGMILPRGKAMISLELAATAVPPKQNSA